MSTPKNRYPNRPCERCGKICRAAPGVWCMDCRMVDFDSEEELDRLIESQRPTMPTEEESRAYKVRDTCRKTKINGRTFADVPMRMRVRTDRRHNGFPIY